MRAPGGPEVDPDRFHAAIAAQLHGATVQPLQAEVGRQRSNAHGFGHPGGGRLAWGQDDADQQPQHQQAAGGGDNDRDARRVRRVGGNGIRLRAIQGSGIRLWAIEGSRFVTHGVSILAWYTGQRRPLLV